MFWFEQTTIDTEDLDDDQDEEITFTDSVVLDAETEAGITILNGDEEKESGSDSDESDESSASESGAEGGDADLPDDVDELVDMFARTGQDNRDSIENIVSEEAPDDYDVKETHNLVDVDSHDMGRLARHPNTPHPGAKHFVEDGRGSGESKEDRQWRRTTDHRAVY